MQWNGNESEKTKVMRISRQPSSIQIIIDRKTAVECGIFKLSGQLYTWNIQDSHGKSRIQEEEALFTSKLDLNLRMKLVNCYTWSTAVWCWKLDTSERRSEIPWKFWNVVLDKKGEGFLDRLCEKWSIKKSQVKHKDKHGFIISRCKHTEL